MKSFYEYHIRRVADPTIKEWLAEEQEYIRKLAERRPCVGIAELVPEYRDIIQDGKAYSYTVAFPTGRDCTVLWDALNKCADFHYVGGG